MESRVRLAGLFNNSVFHIPQYQRAYAWETDPHLVAFLDDLRQQVTASKKDASKSYFLGTFLLHRKPNLTSGGFDNFDIVDGQQRLTTSVVFVASALDLSSKGAISLSQTDSTLFRRKFLKDDDADCHKFHTIEEDEPFFKSSILKTTFGIGLKPLRRSQKFLDEAMKYFQKAVEGPEWPELLKALCESHVLVYEVDNSADATQIFELQNDRGKSLTSLESLKSFLMHSIYLNSKNPEDRLTTIQVQFSKIFRTVEELGSVTGAPDEDAILSYHCAAFSSWTNSEYRDPKKLARNYISKSSSLGNELGVIQWIEGFVEGLVTTFDSVKSLLESRDNLQNFANLSVLGRLAPFWPLILKTWRYDQYSSSHIYFETVCRLMEIYAFRGYAISNMRSDSGLETLYRKARDFEGDFVRLVSELKEMCEWYNLNKRFYDGLDNPKIYETDRSDVLYFLWRYENRLRQETGQKQHRLSWRDYLEPKDQASRFSIEHVCAREDPAVDRMVEWEQGKQKVLFSDIALNRLGNLVIDSISPNSAKGNKDFANKLQHFDTRSIYLSQSELHNFTEEHDENGNLMWGLSAIKRRHDALVKFAQTEWNFSDVKLPEDSNNSLE